MKEFGSLDGRISKKMSRAVDSSSGASEARVCKQCGKGFQSLKALCGHMACHSEKGRVLREYRCYWKSEKSEPVDDRFDLEENPTRRTRSRAERYKKTVDETFDYGNDNNSSSVCDIEDTEDVAACLMMLSRDSRKWSGVNSIVKSSDNQSMVFETKSSSVEMKNPRDDGTYLADEIPQRKKVVSRKLKSSGLVTESVSASGYVRKADSDISIEELFNHGGYKDAELSTFYNRVKHYKTDESKGLKGNEYDDVGISRKLLKLDSKKRARDRYDGVEPDKKVHSRKKYECVNCNRSFDSFQALGGHRPCHKKADPSIQYEYDSGDNSLENDITPISTPIRKLGQRFDDKKPVSRDFPVAAKKKDRAKKSKAHQCPFCSKIFKSGQALGSHKRTHSTYDPPEDFGSSPPTARSLIDLNLPAPEVDGEFYDDNQFNN
ncbi:hypothetical protein DCAR_0727312 [Daucus carota subsp. sativus]|uniref:Uncharacterized protein n=1 Tax=Daucus carota subsp. sativus TaxID=79200 RepID=A0A161X2Q7_DAUCS|nr:PREDICTED: zinc finger protein ZAT4-like [Daucus carota subsp. sativus]WOH07878.1 hypothetical protein DCAR_0727312 [Daucus carota subsp. sativus]